MIYTLHMATETPDNDNAEARFESLVAIPDGKAPMALVFPPVWLVVHRLWWELAFYLLVTFLLFGLLATPYFALTLALGGLPGLYLLLEGHQLRRARAERKGLVHVATVDATSQRQAVARFLSEWTPPPVKEPRQPLQATRRPQRKEDDLSFGLVSGTGL